MCVWTDGAPDSPPGSDAGLRRKNLFAATAILFLMLQEWGTTCLTFEEDPEPFGRVRDQNIMTMCRELNVQIVVRPSHTLYDLQK